MSTGRTLALIFTINKDAFNFNLRMYAEKINAYFPRVFARIILRYWSVVWLCENTSILISGSVRPTTNELGIKALIYIGHAVA
jgi:hypothetical protein